MTNQIAENILDLVSQSKIDEASETIYKYFTEEKRFEDVKLILEAVVSKELNIAVSSKLRLSEDPFIKSHAWRLHDEKKTKKLEEDKQYIYNKVEELYALENSGKGNDVLLSFLLKLTNELESSQVPTAVAHELNILDLLNNEYTNLGLLGYVVQNHEVIYS